MSKGTVFRNDRFSAHYIEVSPIFFLPCGTKFHAFFLMQVTWREEERRIWRAIERRTSIACTSGPPDHDQATCFNLKRYNG